MEPRDGARHVYGKRQTDRACATAGDCRENDYQSGGVLRASDGVAADSSGNLFLAEPNNRRVRKVAGGIITTVAGTGVFGFSGDGGPAASAQLLSPIRVATDAAGSLVPADFVQFAHRSAALAQRLGPALAYGPPSYDGANAAA